jgi:hypothetical protein
MKKLIYINNKEGFKSITHLSGLAEGKELLTLLNAALEYIGLSISEQEKTSVLKDKDPVIIGNPNERYQIILLPKVKEYPTTPEGWKPIKERIRAGFDKVKNAVEQEVKEIKDILKSEIKTNEKLDLIIKECQDGDLLEKLKEIKNTTFSEREWLIIRAVIYLLFAQQQEAKNKNV